MWRVLFYLFLFCNIMLIKRILLKCGGIMLKKILLFICLLVALSGVASAKISSEVDDFDKTKYIQSYFKPGIEKVEGLYIRELVFQKK